MSKIKLNYSLLIKVDKNHRLEKKLKNECFYRDYVIIVTEF